MVATQPPVAQPVAAMMKAAPAPAPVVMCQPSPPCSPPPTPPPLPKDNNMTSCQSANGSMKLTRVIRILQQPGQQGGAEVPPMMAPPLEKSFVPVPQSTMREVPRAPSFRKTDSASAFRSISAAMPAPHLDAVVKKIGSMGRAMPRRHSAGTATTAGSIVSDAAPPPCTEPIEPPPGSPPAHCVALPSPAATALSVSAISDISPAYSALSTMSGACGPVPAAALAALGPMSGVGGQPPPMTMPAAAYAAMPMTTRRDDGHSSDQSSESTSSFQDSQTNTSVTSGSSFPPGYLQQYPVAAQAALGPRAVVAVPTPQQKADVVFTPWFPDGVSYRTIRLAHEMDAFAAFMPLTPEERAKRNSVRTSVQAIVTAMGWGDATVKVYGSFAYGLAIPLSALDLVCENCGPLVDIHKVRTVLSAQGLDIKSAISCGGDGVLGGFAQVEAFGVEANISFIPGESLARRTVTLARGWLSEFPAARPVALMLRAVLSQSRCDSPRTGGLSAYAVLAMVIHICQTMPSPIDTEKLLYTFLLMYSEKFDYKNCAIDAKSPVAVARPVGTNVDDQIYVLDPLDATNNIAAGCTRITQIRAQFKYCLSALGKWDPSAYTHGYKGRTPLSAVISHRWVNKQRPHLASAQNDKTRTTLGIA